MSKEQIKLTKKQKRHADKVLAGEPWTTAALEVYDTDDYMTAAAISSENLKKPKIREYLESKSETYVNVIEEIMYWAEKDDTRLNAAKYLNDQAIGKATQRNDNNNKESWEIKINLVDYSN